MEEQGISFYYSSNFKFISQGIITDVSNFILFPYNVILTSFQSISMISHNMCLFIYHTQEVISLQCK